MKISHAAKGRQENSKTAKITVLNVQLCKQPSGTVAQTQRESLPDTTV